MPPVSSSRTPGPGLEIARERTVVPAVADCKASRAEDAASASSNSTATETTNSAAARASAANSDVAERAKVER